MQSNAQRRVATQLTTSPSTCNSPRLREQTAAACGAGLLRDDSGSSVDGMVLLPGRQSHGEELKMNRRDLLKAGAAAGALGLAPRLASAQVAFAPAPKGWRSYVLTARVEPTGGANRA